MAHPVVHFEIGGRDGQALAAFYGRLFGWRPQSAGPDYWLVPADGGGIGGGLMQTRPGMPSYVTVYVQVEDLDAALDRAAALGARRLVEPTAIERVGSFALFQDPEGNVVGLLATDR
jgi:predicted enzyme related to lactoylglutathione lyase